MELLPDDAIVDIPENRIRYFGGTGKMFLPGPTTIAALISRIPAHKLITTDLLRRELTAQFEVQGTCPVTTKRSLQVVANDANGKVAYWRVLKQNGGLMAFYPGGVEGHAALLQSEGFTIDASGKAATVSKFRESLIRFD